MFFRKVSFFVLVALFTASGILHAAERKRSPNNKNILSFKVGEQFYVDSDFTDYFKIDAGDLNTIAWEIAYERKISRNIGIECTLGYSSSSADSENILPPANDYADTSIRNFYLSPSAKYYLPLGKSFVSYAGVGPDFYYSDVDFEYHKDRTKSSVQDRGDKYYCLGVHGLAGVEYYFSKPRRRRYLASPRNNRRGQVSLLLEYKFAWVEAQDVVDKDLQVGGHFLLLGMRYHY